MDNYPHLAEDIERAPRITFNQRGQYVFQAFSIGERGTRLPCALVDEVRLGLCKKITYHAHRFDYIVTSVPGGNQWGLLIASDLKKSLAVIIDRPAGLRDEHKVHMTSPLYERDLYFSGFKEGDRVVILDDVISTGETMRTIVKTLKKRYKVKIAGIFCIITKGDGYKRIDRSTPVHGLVNISLDGRVIPPKP